MAVGRTRLSDWRSFDLTAYLARSARSRERDADTAHRRGEIVDTARTPTGARAAPTDTVNAATDRTLLPTQIRAPAGAGEPRPTQDLAFMYQRGFEDLDGHLWEVFHMSAPPPA